MALAEGVRLPDRRPTTRCARESSAARRRDPRPEAILLDVHGEARADQVLRRPIDHHNSRAHLDVSDDVADKLDAAFC